MFRKTVAVVIVLLAMAIPGVAQPEGIPPQTSPNDADAPSYEMEESDVVYLKSGKELRGIRIGRENPLYVEIEFLENEAPLQLPRTAIDRIEYASDKISGRSEDGLGDVRHVPHVIPGDEVSVEFNRMLTTPMSEEELKLENVDYLVIIRQHAAKFGVMVDVPAELEALDMEQRKFSRVIPAGTTFMNFLRNDLAQIAPDLRVILKFDKLVLQKREEMEPSAGDIPPPPGDRR